MNISIKVNGEDVRLTKFPSLIITNVIIAMLESLQEVGEIKTVLVELSEEK